MVFQMLLCGVTKSFTFKGVQAIHRSTHDKYSVLLMYYCLRIVHCLCNTAISHRPN
jgi:hypothetical protein